MTQEEFIDGAREVLEYSPSTGLFHWKVLKPGATKPGQPAGGFTKRGYIRMRVNGVHIFAHRLAWAFVHNKLPEQQIDHINGNPADNRIENLRDVPQAVNKQNTQAAYRSNELGLLNIRLRKDNGKYQVRVHRNKKVFNIGEYSTSNDAIVARNIARTILEMPIPA